MKGYTLIELIVVAGIMVLLGGVAVVNFRGGQQGLALDRAAHQIAQDVRRTAGLALQTDPNPNPSASCTHPRPVLSGYGLYFNQASPSSYLLYANCETSGHDCATAGGSCNEGHRTLPPDRDKDVETIFLENPVVLASADAGGGTTAWSIGFFPHAPRITVCRNHPCDDGNSVSSATLVIRLQNDPTQQRTLTITNKGVVNISNP